MCGVLLMMDCDGRTREVGARRRSIRRSLPYEVMYEVPRLACARRSLLSFRSTHVTLLGSLLQCAERAAGVGGRCACVCACAHRFW